MGGVEFDFSELTKLAADLESAPKSLPKHLRSALHTTSKLVKDSAQKKVRGRSTPWRQAAGSIDYDLAGSSGAVSEMSSEIGYNKDKPAGPLGNLLEFGAPRAKKHILLKKGSARRDVKLLPEQDQPLAPGGELQAALHENESDFVTGIARAVDDALREAGL